MSLSHSQSLVALDHAAFNTPPHCAPRSERTHAAVQTSLARMIGDFSSRLYLPSATYLNLVNAGFCAGLFLSCCQRGGCLYLAVTQILILLNNMGTATNDTACCTAVAVDVNVLS